MVWCTPVRLRTLHLFGPPIAWCAAIFFLSDQSELPATPGGDKTAHLVAYGIMAVLFARAFWFGTRWSLPFLTAAVVSAVYGASDELHQSFVPGRDASLGDLIADAIGSGLGALALCLMMGCASQTKTRRDAIAEDKFGVAVTDPYRWLEDVKSEEVKRWMQQENAAARAELDRLPERAALQERLKNLIYVDSRGAPFERGGRLFYWKKSATQEKAVHYVQEIGGEEKVLLDPNTMSADGSISIGDVVPSYDGKLVAYTTKANNADEGDLHVMEIDTKKEIDLLKSVRYTTPSWTPDGLGFFYSWTPDDPGLSESERPAHREVRYHRIGDPKEETFREKTGDPTRWQSAYVSEDGKYLFLSVSHGWSEIELYVMFLEEKKRVWRELAVGRKANYSVDAYKDVFYLLTNDEAPRYRVLTVKPDRLDEKTVLIPEDPESVIGDVTVVGGKLGVRFLKNASTELALFDLDGKKVRTVPLPSIGTASGFIGRSESDTAHFTFTSYTRPFEVHRTSVSSGQTERIAEVVVPLDPEAFEVKQDRYRSKDGTEISMFIVHKKGLVLDGENPALLYGYGGFNLSQTPAFSAVIVPWIERGGVYAVAHLRGGGEYGEAWHQAGMGANKQNVFDDFIAAAEHLIASKYTRKEKLAISGRSNGGLLVGAVMTQRPDLFAAVICGVPLLDMVRYPHVGIGKTWIPEYGDPDTQEGFEILYRYSPYHRVKEGTKYPALLLTSVDSDDRVDPMHARKFHAAIAHASAGREPNLLRIEMNAGHAGADLRKSYLEQGVDELSFLLAETAR
jgi:prolyl oligopeptidase